LFGEWSQQCGKDADKYRKERLMRKAQSCLQYIAKKMKGRVAFSVLVITRKISARLLCTFM